MILTILLLVLALASTSDAVRNSNTYVVHMDKSRMRALDVSVGMSRRWYEAIIQSIYVDSSEGGGEEAKLQDQPTSSPELLYVYENVVCGFSARLSKKHLEYLEKTDGFLSATMDELYSLHTTHSPHFLGLEAGIGLWGAENLASDVIIGVVDTGIWPEHPSFHSTGLPPVPSRWKGKCKAGPKFAASKCNRKLIGAKAFFKGYEAIAGRVNETSDYRSPRDSQGHGTHTASTAGGNLVKGASFLGLAKGTAGGMRYTARIAAYKACYQLGCASSDILAAMDQAVSDGVDVLSLSLGGSSKPYYTDNMAIAAFGAVKKGVFVSASAGNSGPLGSSISNVAPWMATVAASYMDRAFPTIVELGDGRVLHGASLYSGKSPTEPLPLAYGDTAGGHGAKFCTGNSLTPKLVKGRIVICDRGINSRVEKGEQVKIAGGAGMILANGENQGEEMLADAHVLPATSLGAAAAKTVKMYLNSTSSATAVIRFEGAVYNSPAPAMAAFSSRGPSLFGPDIIKPDITAPGVNILAAWPPNISPTELESDRRRVGFNIVSGTSMSCPHISGLAALLKSLHRNWSPAAIKSALMTTAYILDSKNSPIADAASTGSFATPFAFGSGHVSPQKAADPGLIYDVSTKDYLTYFCSLNYNSTQIGLFLRKNFSCPNSSDFQTGDLNYPSLAVQFNRNSKNATATYKRRVTNVGIPVSSYAVKVSEPEGISMTVRPRVLNFRKIGEKLSYKVTFIAKGIVSASTDFSFGSIVWDSDKHSVRSPVAITWL